MSSETQIAYDQEARVVSDESATAAGRVLVVDDDPDIRDVVASLLKRDGHQVCQARDGAEAQKALSRKHFDVVITDLIMPGLSGLDLIDWGKDRKLDVSWIILTGGGTYDDAIAAVRAGTYDYLRKPFAHVDELNVVVNRALQGRRLLAERDALTHQVAQQNTKLKEQVAKLEVAVKVAASQARELDEDLARARDLEETLLPATLPEAENLSMYALYHPSHKIGGDLYDAFLIGSRHLVMYVADASGHGLSAAMMALLVKQHVRPGRHGDDGAPRAPGAVLRTLARGLAQHTQGASMFVSASYAVVDLATLSMRFASAGHPPALLRRSDGKLQLLRATGPAIGVGAGDDYRTDSIQLRHGDRLLFYTDGVTDVGNEARQRFDEARLQELFRRHDQPGETVIPSLMEAMESFAGRCGFEDDLTLLLACFHDGRGSKIHRRYQPAHMPKPAPPGPRETGVLVGQATGTLYVAVHGRGIWTVCPALVDLCRHTFGAGRRAVFDFGATESLDSTFQGTLLEICQEAKRADRIVRIQNVAVKVRRQFEELGLIAVLERIHRSPEPLPRGMRPLLAETVSTQGHRVRLVRAHEALAGVNERNEQAFSRVIDALAAETESPAG